MIRQFFSKLFSRTERGLFTINTDQADIDARSQKFLLENGIIESDKSGIYCKDGKPLIFIDGRLSNRELEEIYGDLLKK